jgi:hypothetical protein
MESPDGGSNPLLAAPERTLWSELMGRLTSTTDFSGFVVNGVILGHPVVEGGDGAEVFAWDFGSLPDGILEADGTIVPSVKPKKGEAVPDPIESWAGLRDVAEPAVTVEVADLAVEVRETIGAAETFEVAEVADAIEL